MKMVSKSRKVVESNLPASKLRMLALSATLPNIHDIGTFLECTDDHIVQFDDSFRPVPLTVHVLGYPDQKNDFFYEQVGLLCLLWGVREVSL